MSPIHHASDPRSAQGSEAPAYAELQTLSNFSFLQSASHPEELVQQAAALGYHALAITDECSFAGIVRAYAEAQKCGLKMLYGSQFITVEGMAVVVLAMDQQGYAQLSALITQARRRAEKGEYRLSNADFLLDALSRCLAIWLPLANSLAASTDWPTQCKLLQTVFAERLWLGVNFCQDGQDPWRRQMAETLQQQTGLPITAVGDVRMHASARLPLHQVLTAIRLRTTIATLGMRRLANAEKCLQPRQRLAQRYPAAWLAETLRIADRCQFCPSSLRYQYPAEVVPAGTTATAHLRELVMMGARERWPNGIPAKSARLIEKELAFIAAEQFEHYFLTVHDIVRFARSQNILCQGRGSAANSVVCYVLGITEADPEKIEVLFERFLSNSRREPPDIDVDFEHERREEVIQYLFNKYGRDRTALRVCETRRSAAVGAAHVQ